MLPAPEPDGEFGEATDAAFVPVVAVQPPEAAGADAASCIEIVAGPVLVRVPLEADVRTLAGDSSRDEVSVSWGILVPTGPVRVLVAMRPVDFRKGMNGLAALVQEQLKADPFSGTIYCFRSKRADRVKLVFWDGTGLCLFCKRLEDGKSALAAQHRAGRRDAFVHRILARMCSEFECEHDGHSLPNDLESLRALAAQARRARCRDRRTRSGDQGARRGAGREGEACDRARQAARPLRACASSPSQGERSPLRREE